MGLLQDVSSRSCAMLASLSGVGCGIPTCGYCLGSRPCDPAVCTSGSWAVCLLLEGPADQLAEELCVSGGKCVCRIESMTRLLHNELCDEWVVATLSGSTRRAFPQSSSWPHLQGPSALSCCSLSLIHSSHVFVLCAEYC